MGLRDRLANRVRAALGKPAAPPQASVAAPPPAVVAPAASAPPVATAPAASPQSASPQSASPQSASPQSAGSPAAPVEDPAEKAAKVEKARTRARKGVLLHVEKEGGSLKMSDAHDYSERRFFIAHRGFSDMMTWWLDADYIRYEEGVVHLTDSGRAFAHEP